jgi:hypothetical protein
MHLKSSRWLRGVMALTVLLVLVLSLAQNEAAQTNNSDSGARKLEGTWRVQITFRNCADGTPTGVVALGLNTFIHGGSMIGTPSAPPQLIRTGHGVWAQLGGQSYVNKLVFFTYSATGVPTGTQEVTRHIELGPGPNEFISADVFDVLDLGGNKVGSGCVTGIGKRLLID